MCAERRPIEAVRQWRFERIARRCQPVGAAELARPAVVLAPHYDDETLGCGGTILLKRRHGAAVSLVFMTDGSTSHAAMTRPEVLARVRRREGREAARRLGIPPGDVTCLEYPDGRLHEFTEAAAEQVAELLRDVRPAAIYAPWRSDGHPDHDATFAIAVRARELAGIDAATWEYPVWAWNVWPWMRGPAPWPPTRAAARDCARFWARTARSSLARSPGPVFTHAVDIRDVVAGKQAALAAHRSQTSRLRPGWPVLADVGGGTFLPCFFRGRELFRQAAPALRRYRPD